MSSPHNATLKYHPQTHHAANILAHCVHMPKMCLILVKIYWFTYSVLSCSKFYVRGYA